MSQEKRKSVRRTLERMAWVQLPSGTAPQLCRIYDMSSMGARISGPDNLPDRFVLLLTPDGSVARKCRVAWRSGNELGVEFIAKKVGAATRPATEAIPVLLVNG
jgi:hypothetical protein